LLGPQALSLHYSDLIAALALLFVLEGILPFLNPGGMKRVFAWLLTVQDRELRIAGLGSMLVGVVLLFLVS
jgi:uncharacterized protein